MNTILLTIAIAGPLVLLGGTAQAQGAKPLKKCAADAVIAGTVCMDKYEASVWRVPDPADTNKSLVKKIQQGTVYEVDLTAAGATQLGTAGDDYAPCDDNGQNCTDDIYAVSLPGVTPSRYITWFQAQVACKNARKRLPSSAEWQAAVVGTQDPGPDDGATDCNTASTLSVASTGSRSNCVSADGAFDMVGNLGEWTSDWMPRSPGPCSGVWSAGVSPTGDLQCLDGVGTGAEPGVIVRGGNYVSGGTSGGPLSINANTQPSLAAAPLGFRCAR